MARKMNYFKPKQRVSFFNFGFLNLALALLAILISGVGCGEKGTSKMAGSPVGDAVLVRQQRQAIPLR